MKLVLQTSRRRFAASVLGAAGGGIAVSSAEAQDAGPKPKGLSPEVLPFPADELQFAKRSELPAFAVRPFELAQVRLTSGSVFFDAQESIRGYLKRLDAERLLHNFRTNAGLASSAQPLGGWEKPDCELRGHFVGHYLSACALMYGSTGDAELKRRGEYLVSELAKCQDKLKGGYLSAFPLEYMDRLDARVKVWAPFYTLHKIMAGLFDMHVQCRSAPALDVLTKMAQWTDDWTRAKSEAHIQDILNTEYGGMNEVLYNLAALTGDDHWAVVGDRFTKKKFFNPLALRRDELRGLHVNTHIPQVIGAARRYEISGDERFHDVAEFFWNEVTEARAYVTGGTSNGEIWRTEPRRLGAELKQNVDTTECCCAYNMLKLTRMLYGWSGDPRLFDYYERVLWNHRVAALERKSSGTQYYLSLTPAAWKTFSTENDSFWCCTGTGVEEFSKLTDSIYFRDEHGGLYVNLFVPSELHWADKGVRVQLSSEVTAQATRVQLRVHEAGQAAATALHLRIPYWAGAEARVSVNGAGVDVLPSRASYLTLQRQWKAGDVVELHLPMQLHIETMPDEPGTTAFLYGPFVLAGKLGTQGLTAANTMGPGGPEMKKVLPLPVPSLRSAKLVQASEGGDELRFVATTTDGQSISFVPFHQLFGERYSVYWNVA
ncbi:MAG: glycoside hydrolase family 127 protein [Rhodospirillales bacterium]|nr:glycoside hydrolase family 127 protein [Acetobacter sp.]